MTAYLFASVPLAMLLTAIIAGIFCYKRSLKVRIQDLAEGYRIIEQLLARSTSAKVADAKVHLAVANAYLEAARTLRKIGDKIGAFTAVDSGFHELREARLLVQAAQGAGDF